MAKTQAYLIHLEGQGDEELKIVDKETFEWLSIKPNFQGAIFIEDIACPEPVKRRIIDNALNNSVPEEDFRVEITSGSWENDRALMAPSIILNDEQTPIFWSKEDMLEWLASHDVEIVDKYEGYIY